MILIVLASHQLQCHDAFAARRRLFRQKHFLNHCPPHLSASIPPSTRREKLGQMKRQRQYQCKATLTLTPFVQALNGCRCGVTFSGGSSAPCALAPKRGGGQLLAAGPQSRIHRNRPFRKTARKRPRAFGIYGHAHHCPSTGLGGVCGCQSTAEVEVALNRLL